MGSYNHTCFVTHQTIATDDNVRLWLVRRQPDISSFTRPDSMWSPIGASIEAKYDDYGLYTLNDGGRDRAKSLLDALSSRVTKHYSNSTDEFLRDDFQNALKTGGVEDAWKLLMTAADRGVLRASGYQDKTEAPVYVAAMHEAAYQGLLSCAAKQRCSVEFKASDCISMTDALFAKASTNMNASSAFLVIIGDVYRAFHQDPILDDVTNMRRFRFSAIIEDYVGGERTAEKRDIAVNRIADEMKDEAVFKALEYMNIAIQPSLYGGQDYGNEVGRMYSELVNSVSTQVSAQRDFDGDYDEDEDDEPTP